MRIAVWHNLPSGGAKRALYNHIKALKEKGHSLEAWTTDIANSEYLPLSDLIPEYRLAIGDEYKSVLKLKNPIHREKETINLLQRHCKKCIIEIESRNFDLVFANSCSITYMPYIGNFTDLPSILYLGEPYRFLYEALPENIWQAPYYKFRLKKLPRIINDFQLTYSRRIRVKREVEAAKSYKQILVNSLFSLESVKRSYGVDSSVCYLGVDTEKFQPVSENKESYIVGIGTISFNKGVHKAVEIVSQIPEKYRPTLKWLANGKDDYYYRNLLEQAALLKVDFKPYFSVTDVELCQIVSKASVLIYTSHLEPFGLAPLEANACGTYVIALAEGGVRESIMNGINGTLIYGYNVSAFVNEILRILKDPILAKKEGQKARCYVQERWNYGTLSENIIREIESINK